MNNIYTYLIYPVNFTPTEGNKNGKRAALSREDFKFDPAVENFIGGFRLGAKIALEIMSDEDGPLRDIT